MNYALSDLIDLEILQQLQDEFKLYANVNAVVVDAQAKPITRGDNFERVLNFILEAPEDGKSVKIKKEYLKEFEKGKTLSFKNSSNAFHSISPIVVEGEFLALFICGTPQNSTHPRSAEQISRGSRFLSSIASVVSKAAYENYISLNNSEMMRQLTKIQSAALGKATFALKNSLKEWGGLIRNSLESNNLNLIKQTLIQILKKGSDVYEIVNASAREIQQKSESISLLETEYDLRTLLSNGIERFRQRAIEKAIKFSCNIDNSVPHSLFGDTERVLRIILGLFNSGSERLQNERVSLDVSCLDVSYSKTLFIKYFDSTQKFFEGELDTLQTFIETSDEKCLKDARPQILGYGAISRLVRQMFGTIDLNVFSQKEMEFQIKIPQLEIEVEELGD